VAAEAARLGVPLAVGITEDAGPGHFTNAQVVVLPDGSLASRYDKVRIVPFGEWLPLRSLIDLVPGQRTDLVSRDAIAGHGPAVLPTPVGTFGVMISWEVFFGGRARDAVVHGGQVLLNPTNGSSYTGTELQTQQIASSRLRALETGRWVVQVAPTGLSAFVTPNGRVLQRTSVREEAVRVEPVALRSGTTWYVHLGEKPVVAAALVVLVLALLLARRDRARAALAAVQLHVDHDSDRSIVDQLEGHLSAEASGGHVAPEGP
jgi:apolipoprotein N-acyltransferase